MTRKKILVTAGGTGGHIYPAMALAKQLMQEELTLDVLFVGGGIAQKSLF